MNTKEAKQRMEKLIRQIDDLRYRYHVVNDPRVDDSVYDGLQQELARLEKEFPQLKRSDSPLRRVGGEALKAFKKITHEVPQWSFNDAFSPDDVREWETRIVTMLKKKYGEAPRDLNYVAELKIDGLHIVLTYRGGELHSAATRGNGTVGEDVTHNILTIHSVPLTLAKPRDITVEGEVWMSTKVFEELNAQREKNNEPLFANPRNAAAGGIRQLDPRLAAARKLDAYWYDISKADYALPTQERELRDLKTLGFKVNEDWKVCAAIDDVLDFWKHWEAHKRERKFWIDGVVVKVNQKKYQEALGYTGKAPRWALAIKFAAEKGTTKVKDVYVQVGRTGVLTPVALLEPVALAGTTVTHATLHNFDEIERLDVRIGDTVAVEKAGDIIPKIIQSFPALRSGKEKKVKRPLKCPMCGSAVAQKPGEVALYCTNINCYALEKERVRHFASKHAFDIEGLGEKIVELLMDEKLVADVADLFTLEAGDLEVLEGFAQKKARKLADAVAAKKQIPLDRFIFALGIRHVGEETAYALARHFSTWESLRRATREELERVHDIGPAVAASIEQFFSDKKNQELLTKLERVGVRPQPLAQEARGGARAILAGATFVLTGTLATVTREQAKELIRSHGGEVSSAVSKKTTYVVAGEQPGSKYDRAQKLGVRILNEEAFKKLLK